MHFLHLPNPVSGNILELSSLPSPNFLTPPPIGKEDLEGSLIYGIGGEQY